MDQIFIKCNILQMLHYVSYVVFFLFGMVFTTRLGLQEVKYSSTKQSAPSISV